MMEVKQVIFLRSFFAVSLLAGLLFAGCSSEKAKEERMLGEWHALWQTTAHEDMANQKDENLQMNGKITFMEDGKVMISAFGFEGCQIYEDTLLSTLNWKISDGELRLIDQGDDYGLPYVIKKFSADEMKLTLLEDIHLTLSRN